MTVVQPGKGSTYLVLGDLYTLSSLILSKARGSSSTPATKC